MSGIHIYAPAGYYCINHNNMLGFFDLSGWFEPNGILWRKKYERIKSFKKRCREYVKKQNGVFVTHKQGTKIVMRNIRREARIMQTLTPPPSGRKE